ncbi:MAG: endonuclease [Lachnospiraceae bacterium]|nr:endonuclease [Lachnospiraceae bacterium]
MKKENKNRKWWQKLLGIVVRGVGAVLLLAGAVVVWLMATEYQPKEREMLVVSVSEDAGASEKVRNTHIGDTITIMTWNMGYGALGENADFFMDGGKGVMTASKAQVEEHLAQLAEVISACGADAVFLQEADRDSTRSHGIDEMSELERLFQDAGAAYGNAAFAYNFKVKFIPYPLPPIGKVNGGILTFSNLDVESAERVQLPCPFTWPVRLVNLKRCLMLERIPVLDEAGEQTGKELVLVNLHLEAYDSGEGKVAQTKMLREILQAEVDRGNYVIAGGDFNQTFSSVDDQMYPEYEGNWHCGELDVTEFGADFNFVMDNSSPTCRSLDQPYAGADWTQFQYYMIDGFIVSKNLKVESAKTKNLEFVSTDHNPVLLAVTLAE